MDRSSAQKEREHVENNQRMGAAVESKNTGEGYPDISTPDMQAALRSTAPMNMTASAQDIYHTLPSLLHVSSGVVDGSVPTNLFAAQHSIPGSFSFIPSLVYMPFLASGEHFTSNNPTPYFPNASSVMMHCPQNTHMQAAWNPPLSTYSPSTPNSIPIAHNVSRGSRLTPPPPASPAIAVPPNGLGKVTSDLRVFICVAFHVVLVIRSYIFAFRREIDDLIE